MNLPKQVQEREQRSNEAIEQLQKARQPEAAAEIAPEQETEQQPPPPKAEVPDAWEARYKTLQGKYNSEVPRLSELVRTQQSQIETLKREVESIKSAPPAADTRTDADLPEELRDRFDPVMIQAMTHIAAKSAERAVQPIKPMVETMRTRDDERSQQLLSEQQRADMLEALDDLVPGWAKVDDTPGFAQHLQSLDPATGKPLRETLVQAIGRFDAVKTARIFRGYMASLPPPVAAPRTPSLESQQVPDIAGAGTSAPSGDKRIFTEAEVKAEMTRAALMANSNPQRAAAIEREIELASRENRIR